MAGSADWSIAIGVFVFIIAIIFAAYYFLRYRKIFTVVLIASIATYVFAVFYTFDVFDLNKNMILVMLAISAVVMMALGKYFSKFELKPARMHTSLKEKKR